jgi:signal transduction histidine kinase
MILLALMALAGAGSSLVGYCIIARPLLSRVHSISRSAAAIGTPSFQLPVESEWDDLKALTAALAAADTRIRADEAVLADRSQQLESVIASVAHDLKTPLATLQLMLQRLIDQPEPAEATRLGRGALDAAHSVAALLSNLEIDTQIKAGQLDTAQEATDLRRLLEQLEIRFRVLGDLRQIEIRASWPDEPVWTKVDPTIAERILSNLIQNALAHGRPFGHVAVLLKVTPQTFVVTIADDGPGFPAEVVAAFNSGDPIVSAANTKRRPLGLAIVAKLGRHTGWNVDLGRAEPRSGASVVVSGPLLAVGPHSPRAAASVG